MAVTPPSVNGSDPSIQRQVERQTATTLARVEGPVNVGAGTTTPASTGRTRSTAPVVSGSEVIYPQSTTGTSSDAVTITSSTNNDSGDITTVYSTNGQITVNPINQTINQYTTIDSGVAQIVAGDNITITSSAGNGTGIVTISSTGGGNGDYGNSNVANYLPTYTGNVGAGNVNVTGTVYANGLSSTGLASLTTLNVSATANLGAVGNVKITGGTAGQVLSTDGTGNLSWATDATTYGNSNVVTLLSAFGSNTITTTGNVSVGNIIGNGQALTNIAGANVSGQVGNALVAGTVYTAAQPNITSVGTLSNLNVSGNSVISGNLTVGGNLVYVNVTTLSVVDPIIDLQTGPNGAAPVANSGKDVGTALNYYDTQARVAFMGWDVSNAEFGLASQASINSEVVTFTNYGNLRAGNIAVVGNVTANYFNGIATDVVVEAVNNNYSYHMAFVTGAGDTTLHMDNDDNLQYNPSTGLLTANRIDVDYLSVDTNIISNLIPFSNVTQDLGNNTNRWNDLYLANSTIYLGDATISANGNSIVVDSITVTGGNVGNIGNIASINLDGSNANVLYGNGVFAPASGGGANTGNVTFSDQVVMGTGSNDGTGGLYLAPGNASIANSAVQYLRVRGGDAPTHIHLDTGNNQFYDQYFGDDAKYVKLELGDAGNVVIGTDDANGNLYSWSFTSDGNLILADGNSVIQSIANSSLDPLNPNVSTMVLTPDPGYSSQALVLDPTATGHIHLRAPGANIDEPSANIFLGGETSSFEVGYYNGAVPNLFIHSNNNTWMFDIDGNITFPRDGSNISTDPYLKILGGPSPQILSEDASLAGPANLAIVTNYLNLSGSTGEKIAFHADDGLIATDYDMVLTTNVGGGNTYTWTLDATGNLTLPGNLVIAGNANVFGTNSSLLQTTDNRPLLALSSGANGAVSSLWVEDIGNVGTSNIAAVYANPTVGSKIVRIAVGQNGGNTGPNIWDFNANGTLTFPGTPRIDTADDNFEVQAAEAINFEANTVVNIYTDSGNNAYQWQFGDDGNLTLPDTTSVIANASITLEANSTGNITGLSVNGDADANLYAHGNVKIVSDSSNTTATWSFGLDGNLTIPNNVGGFIKTASNASIGIVAMDNGTNNPAQLLSMNVGTGAATSIVSAYATNATIQTNASGNINTWAFDNSGNLTLPTGGQIIVSGGLVSSGASPAPTINGFSITNSVGISGNGNIAGNNISATGNISGNTNGFTIGYLNIPQVAAANATLALTDAGKHYYSTTAGNFTLTVPTNANAAFATGTAISIVVQAAGNVLVNAASGVTLYMAGNSSAANRVVGSYGMATLLKVASDTWFINGTGVA